MSDKKSNTKNEQSLIKTLNHFNSLLISKLQKSEKLKENNNMSVRKGNDISDTSEPFLAEYNDANMLQYSHLYFLRLKLVKQKLVELSKKKWKGVRICENILETRGNVKNFFYSELIKYIK
jgi:hypothetical protein